MAAHGCLAAGWDSCCAEAVHHDVTAHKTRFEMMLSMGIFVRSECLLLTSLGLGERHVTRRNGLAPSGLDILSGLVSLRRFLLKDGAVARMAAASRCSKREFWRFVTCRQGHMGLRATKTVMDDWRGRTETYPSYAERMVSNDGLAGPSGCCWAKAGIGLAFYRLVVLVEGSFAADDMLRRTDQVNFSVLLLPLW